jgi:hypothetical protein
MSTLHEDISTFSPIFCFILFRMRNVFDKRCRENQNAHFILNNFFPKMAPFMRYVEKLSTHRGVTNDNMEHTTCMLE